MAIADGGELIILAPGVDTFGEDEAIDALIRKHGYRTTPEVLKMLEESRELMRNLSAAAHLIHSSSEGRFRITWCPGHLTKEEVENVGYHYGHLGDMLAKYGPDKLQPGMNLVDGEEVYFIRHPAVGLWACRQRFEESDAVPSERQHLQPQQLPSAEHQQHPAASAAAAAAAASSGGSESAADATAFQHGHGSRKRMRVGVGSDGSSDVVQSTQDTED